MKISGLQKTTLLDYPGYIACTVFLSGCNLRCPFCHNAPLVLPANASAANAPQMTEEDLISFLQSRARKLDGVCITGGEPTLQSELPELIRRIRALGFLVKLDTNGTNPELLSKLIEEGLVDYVAMDIKNAPEHYTPTCGGIDVLKKVQRSAALLLKGLVDYEFRTTVAAPFHTPARLQAIGEWLAGARRYYLQQFVDTGNLVGDGAAPLSLDKVRALRQSVLPYIPNTYLRGIEEGE